MSLNSQVISFKDHKLDISRAGLVVPDGKGSFASLEDVKKLETQSKSKNNIIRATVKDYDYDETTGLYTPLDISFVNTHEFSRAAQYFKKHGRYTHLHPKYDKYEYREFWMEERRRRIEGYTVGGVTITGEHYTFLNYSPILRTVDPDDISEVIKDPNNFRGIIEKSFTFPDFWDGHYKWFKLKAFARRKGKHVLGGKSRRKGFSYVGGCSAGNIVDLYPRKTVLLGASDTKFLTKGDGLMTMARTFLNHLAIHTPWNKRRIVNGKEHLKFGYKRSGEDAEYGFLSQILAISFKNNAEAAIGKDAYEIGLDELGKMDNFKEVLDVTTPTLEDGSLLTGQIIGWGTGGSKEENWNAFRDVFYNPSSYGFLTCNNIWDDDSTGTECGFFFPYIQNLASMGHQFMDKDGNSKLEPAKEQSDKERAAKKKSTRDASTYVNYCAQRANKPSEAFSSSGVSFFYSLELADHVTRLNNDRTFRNFGRPGVLVQDERGRVRLMSNAEIHAVYGENHPTHEPIYNFPLGKEDDMYGCYLEWQTPFRDKFGNVPKNLYRIWHDPYAASKVKEDITIKDSLGVAYVYERPNNITPTRGDHFIGALVGRPPNLNSYNEQLYRLCLYVGGYDGILLYEADRGDVYEFFKHKRALNLLADEPEFLWNKDLAGKSHTRSKGIKIGSGTNRKSAGALYFLEWLNTVRGESDDGVKRYNFHTILDPALGNELLRWNLKGNFDRVSTMIVGMFDAKEQMHKEIELVTKVRDANSYFSRKLYSN